MFHFVHAPDSNLKTLRRPLTFHLSRRGARATPALSGARCRLKAPFVSLGLACRSFHIPTLAVFVYQTQRQARGCLQDLRKTPRNSYSVELFLPAFLFSGSRRGGCKHGDNYAAAWNVHIRTKLSRKAGRGILFLTDRRSLWCSLARAFILTNLLSLS